AVYTNPPLPTVFKLPCPTLPGGARGEHPLAELKPVRPEPKNRNAPENILVGIEVVVMVDALARPCHPFSLWVTVCLRRTAFDDVVVFVLALICVWQHEILEEVNAGGKQEAHDQQRHCHSIQTHSAGLHRQNLIRFRECSQVDEDCKQHG